MFSHEMTAEICLKNNSRKTAMKQDVYEPLLTRVSGNKGFLDSVLSLLLEIFMVKS